MPNNVLEERLRWVLPIINKEVKLKDVLLVCPHGSRTLKRWLKAYRGGGLCALEPKRRGFKTGGNPSF